jgi:glycosyltransferase involved in cell wall biosynthesis
LEKLKKVVFTVTNDLSYDQRMARICTSLANANYDIELVGRKRKNSVPLTKKSYCQKRLNCFFEKGKIFYIEYNIRLFFYLLFKNVDVVSSVDLDTLLPCTLISRIRSKKLVFDAHEYFTEVPEVTNRKLIKSIWETIAKLCIPKVDSSYTVGKKLAEIFTEKHHKTFEVIRNVPDLTTNNKPQTLNFKPIILYQGDLNEGRGLEQMIESMQKIDAEFLIAGNGLLLENLKQLSIDFHVSEKVKFLGYINPDELKTLTANATIGVNILENKGLSYFYSLANKFFDYMHAGVPQICAPFPEYENINTQFNVALPCECKVERIIEKINSLLKDEKMYEKMHAECLNAKEIFNWQKEEKKLLKIYGEICK